jgi:hypothetical protein
MSGQRVHAEEQVVLTGSVFHISRKKTIEALWVTLPRHSRYPQIVKRISLFAPDSRNLREKLDGAGPVRLVCFVHLVSLVYSLSLVQPNKRDKPNKLENQPTAPVLHVLLVSLRLHERRPKKGQLTWEHLVVSANVSLTGTCVQNFRIILGKYLNVKLAGHIILKDR